VSKLGGDGEVVGYVFGRITIKINSIFLFGSLQRKVVCILIFVGGLCCIANMIFLPSWVRACAQFLDMDCGLVYGNLTCIFIILAGEADTINMLYV